MAADPVDRGRADGTEQCQGDEEDPGVHGGSHSQVPHVAGLVRELFPLGVVASEQLHQQRSGDSQPLGHERVHVGVVLHLPPCEGLQAPTDALGGEHEDRQQRQGQQCEPPIQDDEHRQQRDQQDAEIGHQLTEGAGHGPLGADHVVVEAADERAGLHAGEERHPHALHVVVQGHAQVEDEPLADARRPPALAERQQRLDERGAQDEAREQVHVAPVGVDDGVVDDLPEQQRRHLAQQGAQQDGHHEQRDHALVRDGEGQHPARHGAVHGASLHRLGVTPQRCVQTPVHTVRLGRRRHHESGENRSEAPADLLEPGFRSRIKSGAGSSAE